MKTFEVILWERTGIWATAMLRSLPCEVRLVQTRGRAECIRQLALAPTSLAALELTPANLANVIAMTRDITAMHPWAAVVVLAEPELAACEPVVREAGALHFFVSPREFDGWRQTVLNHFGRIPLRTGEFAESVWESLPWSDAVGA
ncbi:MAG: hypothetical protein WD845_08515 [Pirellulales bacterium]